MLLHYEEYGDAEAPLMVFIHGGGVSSWMWHNQVQYFTNYHCVTVDLPEQGSNLHHDKFSIEDSAKKIIELINAFPNKKSITVVGFSLGAQVLIQILSEEADLIDYAIINSALVKPSKLGKLMIRPLIRLTFPLIKNPTFSKLQAKTLYIGEEDFERYYQESSQMEQDTLVRILEENMSFNIPDGFEKAEGKILVTVGEKENTVMKKSAKALLNANDNCIAIMIAGAGHGAPMSQATLFNQLIEIWLNKETVQGETQMLDGKYIIENLR